MRTTVALGLVVAAFLLAGCENDAASWQGAEPGVSLTLIREQHRFWDKRAEVAVVVARMPDCQRRHGLGATRPADAEVEIFTGGSGQYFLRQDEEWYLATTADCGLEPARAPAPPPPALGSFRRESGRLRFVTATPPA